MPSLNLIILVKMPNTYRQHVSDIVNNLRALNIDDRISSRFVLSILKDKAKKFIYQNTDNRRLFSISEVWKRIPCVHMEEITFAECGLDVPQTNRMMKSCIKIPEVFQTVYGNLIKVFTIDGLKEYVQTTLTKYKEIVRREHVDPNVKYFMLIEEYIYVPNSQVEEIMVFGLFKNPDEVSKIVDCDGCFFPLDETFSAPEFLLDLIKSETKIELLKEYKPVIVDETPNRNSNQK